MGSLEIVMINPIGNLIVRLVKRHEIMLPDALLLEAPEESLDHAVLLRRIRRYVLLVKMIFCYCLVKPFRTKHKSVVGPDHKPMHIRNDVLPDQGILQRPGRDPCLPGPGKPPADKISVGTVDYRNQVAPAVLSGEKVRHVDRPAAVRLRRDTLHPFHSRPVAIRTLPTLPAMLLHDPVDLLAVEGFPVPPAQYCGDSSSSVFGELLDHLAYLIDKPRFRSHCSFLARPFGVVHVRPVEAEHLADLADACPNPVFHQFALQGQDSVSSEVPHKAFAFFNMAFSTYRSPIAAFSSLISFSVCS